MMKQNRTKRTREVEGVGNTANTPHTRGIRQPPQYQRWCFTLNNYRTIEQENMILEFKDAKYMIGEEVGESGTPHLQGYVEFKKRRRITELKKINERIHWEPCNNTDASIKYCMKDNKYKTNIEIEEPLELWKPPTWWADEIEQLYLRKPEKRIIYWYWDSVGNLGKSEFSKYMAATYGVTVVQSCKSADILTCIETKLKMLILDFPRDSRPGTYFPAIAIEQIKNGMITDAKLKKKARCLLFNSPHIVVFANEPPDMQGRLSSDRLIVKEITKEQDHVASTEGPRSLSEQDIV